MESNKMLLLLPSLLSSFLSFVTALSYITPNQPIIFNQTLVSEAGNFEAGFFSFNNSSEKQYFGIWYHTISPRTIVWVANRDTPLENSSGGEVFKLNGEGNLAILDGSGATIWSSNSSTASENPVLLLLDSGNLVVIDGNNLDNRLWQSFDHPGDTLLPGMKLESNLITGEYKSLTCWRDAEDPAPGEFSAFIDPHGLPQLIIKKGNHLQYRAGSWNGFLFTGAPWKRLHHLFNYSFVLTKEKVYYGYDLLNSSTVTRYVLSPSGIAIRFTWSDKTNSWEFLLSAPTDQCDNYAMCGPNSNCDANSSPVCDCLEGFREKHRKKWESSDWSDGCVRRVRLSCDINGDRFVKYEGVKLADTCSSWFEKSMGLEECKTLCLRNCSCTAYANLDVRDGGSGCLLWFNDIMDLSKHSSDEGQEIYIRVAASELVPDQLRDEGHGSIGKKEIVAIAVGCTIIIMSFILLGFTLISRKRKLQNSGKEVMDVPTFDFSVIAKATNNFSTLNKLGEGGFGPVYKGILEDGQEFVVKKLSTKSGQGLKELRNEVVVISKLQHRNLVKLLGCCIEGEEKLLIYEYMPNKSLDNFIFDEIYSNLLDWRKRWHIIHGIARGLVYLHIDSRLRIIHRDLKTSNILLDACMNPKISDFGLARTFWDEQVEANTNKVVGTYGYMPPEYAVHGQFSMKSDIFSFGVIVLEIVSGKKNRGFADPKYNLNLLGHAWRLWTQGRPMELLDECLNESCTESEVIRCIHVGLLCVQQRVEDRPDMSAVVLMLNGEKLLPQPKVPAFYIASDVPSNPTSLDQKCTQLSQNEISQTTLEGR
ncbi:hypothetical protein K1719_042409 [Acacia pycnantha]|nr:hypothetical protein K1719_042409 [Acacia pycnantha]